MQPIESNAATAEQQALHIFGQLAADYNDFVAASSTTELKGFRITALFDVNTLKATFNMTIPLAKNYTASGGMSLTSFASEVPQVNTLASLEFWNEPLTFANGQTLEF